MGYHLAAMSHAVTLTLLIVALAVAVFAGWRGSRPPDLIRGPRMVPYRFVMVLASTVVLFMLLHLLTLAGYSPPAVR